LYVRALKAAGLLDSSVDAFLSKYDYSRCIDLESTIRPTH
jgi:hypothetical protein